MNNLRYNLSANVHHALPCVFWRSVPLSCAVLSTGPLLTMYVTKSESKIRKIRNHIFI